MYVPPEINKPVLPIGLLHTKGPVHIGEPRAIIKCYFFTQGSNM